MATRTRLSQAAKQERLVAPTVAPSKRRQAVIRATSRVAEQPVAGRTAVALEPKRPQTRAVTRAR